MKKTKRLFCFFLAAVMAVSIAPMAALADEASNPTVSLVEPAATEEIHNPTVEPVPELEPIETAPHETEPSAPPVESLPDEVHPLETLPNEEPSLETLPVEALPLETLPNEEPPRETLPIETLPLETLPEDTTPIYTTPEESVFEETIPEQTESLLSPPVEVTFLCNPNDLTLAVLTDIDDPDSEIEPVAEYIYSLLPGTYFYIALKDGYAPALEEFTVDENDSSTIQIDITLEEDPSYAFAITTYAAQADMSRSAIFPSAIYLQQNTNYTCTLASAAMMLRARMYLSGNNDWQLITESAIEGSAWINGTGLGWSWSYSINGSNLAVAHEFISGFNVTSLKSLLDSHPEGIVLYCGGGNNPHAVFLTDYDGETFYCADPASGYSGNRIPLSSSLLGYLYGSQTGILNNVNAYWYISSYSISASSFVVTFNANGGACSTSTKSVSQGSAIGSLPIPVNSGYTFLGWYTSVSDGTKVTENTTISSSMTLYAQWAANNNITLYDATGSAWITASRMAGASYTLPRTYPTVQGSYFSGWAYSSGGTVFDVRPGDTITVTSDVSLYPVYVTHAEAISGKQVLIYHIEDFTASDYVITAENIILERKIDTSYWTDWSNYSLAETTASNTIEVRTKPMYRYYFFLCPGCGVHNPLQGTCACGATNTASGWQETWSTLSYMECGSTTVSFATNKRYTTSLGDGQLWYFSSGNLNDTSIGTNDSGSSATVIKNGYSNRRYVERLETKSDSVTAYRISKTALKILAHPTSVSTKTGASVSFTVSAQGSNLSYQWQTLLVGSTNWVNTGMDGNKTNTLFFDTAASLDGRQYRCAVSDGTKTVYSNPATLTVTEELKIIANPANVSVKSGASVSFSVSAQGSNLSYQWQTLSVGSSTWVNTGMSGNKTAKLSFTTAAVLDGRKYRCAVSDGTKTVYSNAATLTLTDILKITAQPANVSVKSGASVSFTVSAQGSNLSYQWQTLSVGSTNWVNTGMNGNKTAKLSFTTAAVLDGRKYRCAVSDGTKTVYSNAATLTLNDVLKITANPTNVSVKSGASVSFSVSAQGSNLSYQWQTLSVGSSTWVNTGMNGNKMAKLSFTTAAVLDGRKYRCAVSDGSKTVYSNAATLTLTDVLKITAQPANVSAKSGASVSFTVSAQGNNLSYQWQTLAVGSTTWVNTGMNGNKTAKLSFTTAAVLDGRKYRCAVSDGSKTIYSNAATLTLTDVLKITAQPTSVSVKSGASVSYTVSAQGSNLSYQWQTLSVGSTTWVNTGMNGNKTAKLSFTTAAVLDGRKYRCAVSDGSKTVYSNAATLTLTDILKITAQPANISVKSGASVSFTVSAKGSNLSYQWQTLLVGTSNWVNTGMDGNKTNTLFFDTAASLDERQYRCAVSDGTKTVYSNAAKLTLTDVLKITAQPANVSVKTGASVSFTVSAKGSNLSYQWQTLLVGASNWVNTGMDGNKTSTLFFDTATFLDGRKYRCAVSDGSKTVYSNAATLTLTDVLKITAQPASVSVKSGASVSFSVSAQGSNLSYQWQTLTVGSTNWVNTGMSGNKTAKLSFTTAAVLDGRKYRCAVSDGSKTVYSNPATLTLVEELRITGHPASVNAKTGDTISFTVSAQGSNLSYQWQTLTVGSTNWVNTGMSGNKTAKLSFAASTTLDGRQYRCVVTDMSGNSATSKAAKLNILPESDFIYEVLNDEITITGYKGTATNITIPSKIGCYPVTRIADFAFKGTVIRNINIPTSISYIGNGAFADCEDLHVFGESNSYAEYWSNSNHVPFNIDWKIITGVKTTVDRMRVTITWNADEVAEGYQICEMVGSSKTLIGETGAVTYYSIDNVTANTHTYVVEPFKTIKGTKTYGTAVQVEATVETTLLSLQALQTKFPNGMYWNHYVSAEWETADNLLAAWNESFSDSVTWSKCASHSTSYTVGMYDCNFFDGGEQCAGFARKLGFDAYGTRVTSWGTSNSIWSIKPGDVVHYYGLNADSKYGHWVFVTAVSGTTITVGECNIGSNLCMIRWGHTYDMSQASSVTVYSAPWGLS